MASYYAWYPVLESKGTVISMFLSHGECNRSPEGGRKFFETLLSVAGVYAPIKAWGVHSFLTQYFSSPDWQECWEAIIILNQPVTSTLAVDVKSTPVLEMPESYSSSNRQVPVRVLADFASRKLALECRTKLKERAARAKWNEVHYEGYKFRDVARGLNQLAVTVATIDPSRLADVLQDANEVISICESSSGVTSRQLDKPASQLQV